MRKPLICSLGFFLVLACFARPSFSFAATTSTATDAISTSTLIALANRDRAAAGLFPLQDNGLLELAAQMKADDMVSRGYFSHDTPDHEPPWHWLALAGYDFTSAGENLAVLFAHPESIEKAWMASPDHRANILGEHYADIGIGIATGTYRGIPTTYVVEFFGAE
jgi:uncharacterized protein YkwD